MSEVEMLCKNIIGQRINLIYAVIAVVKLVGKIAKCVGSPFEVNNQLVVLQDQGILDFIISNDRDLFVRGGDNVIMQFSVKAKVLDNDTNLNVQGNKKIKKQPKIQNIFAHVRW